MHTPLIIIGAGPGGYETAVLAAQRGIEVVLIEASAIGGTCLNEGCIPTKSFCKNAQVINDLKEAELYGIEGVSYNFNFAAVTERKNSIVSQLKQGVATLLSHKLIHLVEGKAQFVDAHTVEVNGEQYSADNIIIATGSVSKFLPIEGAHLPGVLTSKEMLELTEIPRRLCVIGAGVIGLEFASIFNSFGSEVTVVEFCKEILPRFDTDIAKRLKQSLSKRGIEILTQTGVTSIKQEGEEMQVSYNRKGKEETITVDRVLMAVGRRANTDSLNLADVGIEFTPAGIKVNAMMQTNVPHIYAIGDVTGGIMLAHAATWHGIRALNHICGNENDGIRLDVIPGAVFTVPEVATVGLTEDECKDKGIDYRCGKAFFRANGKALCMNEPDGLCKVIADADGKLLGCHLYGPHAADLVQEVCALISTGATVDQLKRIIHTHPTLGEVIQTAAHTM